MANGPNLGQKSSPRKRLKKRRSKGNQKILRLSLVAVAVVVFVIFLIAAGEMGKTSGAVICMLTLVVIFYLMTIGQSKPRSRKRRAKSKTEVQTSEPQFYTALPSSLGLTEIPEEQPRPQVKLPPRPIRAARRRRDFIAYPVAVGGGDYSDSYVQVDKDTVLRLRSEMTPESEPKYLPGLRLDLLPSSKIAAVMSQAVVPSVEPVEAVVAEAVPVVAEAVPVVAETVAESTETPVVQSVVVQEEEEEQMDFDMEWD
uniref:Transmembrane protein n=1 Tax=uncultured marine group II/III euryarchaeote SAT1000_24_G08 TaxID=1456569 RepID=A0A075I8E6_9EURY|nr:hypothetical protein [uncultured marine group II/III euryarchaeote SAT1000_24_G08]